MHDVSYQPIDMSENFIICTPITPSGKQGFDLRLVNMTNAFNNRKLPDDTFPHGKHVVYNFSALHWMQQHAREESANMFVKHMQELISGELDMVTLVASEELTLTKLVEGELKDDGMIQWGTKDLEKITEIGRKKLLGE